MSRYHTLDEGIRIALDSVRANKGRASLTILGVAIGVAVVVTMAALITGIRSEVLEGFEAAGPENFIVSPFDFTDVRLISGSDKPPWWDRPDITDIEARLVESLPAISEAIVAFDFNATLNAGGESVTGVSGAARSSGWPNYALGEFVAGRNYTPTEADQNRAVVVLSEGLANDLFEGQDPIGKRLRVSAGRRGVNPLFTVVGVFKPEENIFSALADRWAVVPIPAAKKRLKALTRFQFVQLFVVPQEGYTQSEAQDQVIGALRASRGLRPKDANNFDLIRSDQLVELFNSLTSVFFLVMLALSSVGLLVGGIGVIGIMMISVTERTREIGIRKSVGATKREILWQFLVEAAFLTLLGGATGMVMGALTASGVANITPIPARIPLWSVAAALAMAVVTGVLFGLYPAMRAARMAPVEALRHE